MSFADSESKSKQPSQTTGCMSSSSSSFYLDINLEASAVTLKRPTSENIMSTSSDCNDGMIEHKEVNFKTQENNTVPENLLNDTILIQDIKK